MDLLEDSDLDSCILLGFIVELVSVGESQKLVRALEAMKPSGPSKEMAIETITAHATGRLEPVVGHERLWSMPGWRIPQDPRCTRCNHARAIAVARRRTRVVRHPQHPRSSTSGTPFASRPESTTGRRSGRCCVDPMGPCRLECKNWAGEVVMEDGDLVQLRRRARVDTLRPSASSKNRS